MPRRRQRRLVALGVVVMIAVIVVGAVLLRSERDRDAEPTVPSMAALNPGDVTLGRAIYLKNCASCHGANAQGAPNWTQPDARGNLPPPPHDDSGHTWRHSDAELTGIIQNGLRDVFNKTPELTMPPFKGKLSAEEISAVITYFKSLWSPEHRQYQEDQNQRAPMPMATPESMR